MTWSQDERQQQIEERMAAYVHSAKRMVLDLFGSGADHEHMTTAVQLAAAMAQLEAAYEIADATDNIID